MLSCVHQCPVSLAFGALAWSVICDFVFLGHTHLFFACCFIFIDYYTFLKVPMIFSEAGNAFQTAKS